jgi:error-prone DNA polymerase
MLQLAGMAVARQRPATANGIVFMLIEDEHGQANLILPAQVYEQHRAIVRGEPLLLVRGKLERSDRNVNLLVSKLTSLGPLARKAASEAEVTRNLPRAHHFGHR